MYLATLINCLFHKQSVDPWISGQVISSDYLFVISECQKARSQALGEAASKAENDSWPDTSGIVLDTQHCKVISTKLFFYNDKDSLMNALFFHSASLLTLKIVSG